MKIIGIPTILLNLHCKQKNMKEILQECRKLNNAARTLLMMVVEGIVPTHTAEIQTATGKIIFSYSFTGNPNKEELLSGLQNVAEELISTFQVDLNITINLDSNKIDIIFSDEPMYKVQDTSAQLRIESPGLNIDDCNYLSL